MGGGFSQSKLQESHQETKFALWDIRDVARKGWRQIKAMLLDSPARGAISLAVEKLARILKRERASIAARLHERALQPPQKVEPEASAAVKTQPSHNRTNGIEP